MEISNKQIPKKAIIFSAGLGTRFKPWTDANPKALALINGKTLLQRNIEYLQLFNITDVVVNVHHFPEKIIDEINKNNGWGSNIIISDETDEVLETGGGLLKAKKHFENEDCFVSLNVDVLSNFNLNDLIRFHKEKNPLISFVVSNRKSSRNILLNESNRLCGWQNNITGEQKIVLPDLPLTPFAYNCIVIYSKNIFEHINQTGKFSIMDTYLNLAANHQILGYSDNSSKWVDVGKPESVAIAEGLF